MRYPGFADTLLGSLTVAEMLMYTANLKRPMHEEMEKKKHAVDALLVDLGLTSCSNTLIGSPMARGISGGEVCY
jgi:ATP-binding cassette subfamily G (WHITE) protein 2